jgi:hypothetical protein
MTVAGRLTGRCGESQPANKGGRRDGLVNR